MTDTEQDRPAPERLLELGGGLAIYRVHVDDMLEQEVNARAMTPAMFDRLTQTIGRDKRLESLPLAALTGQHADGRPRIEIVSGHHRTRAARAGGVSLAHVIVDETGLTRDQIRAKQLAHNSIAGDDEPQLLARIYQEIQDVDARLETFIDPASVGSAVLDKVSLPDLDLTIDYRTVLLTFLPNQAEQFDRAVEQLLAQADLDRDQIALVDAELFDRWQATMRRLRKEYDARGLSTVIARLLDAAAELLGIDPRDPDSIDPEAWVPLSEVLGSAVVPPEVADVLRLAVDRALDREDVTKQARWRLLELLCADYLAGA